MSNDLITWLRAQLDEDEVIARRATTVVPGPWRYNEARNVLLDQHGLDIAKVGYVEGQHIPRHDPTQVLRDIAAKRALVDALEEPTTASNVAEEEGLIRAVQIIASAYADRLGYRKEWAA